MKNLTRPSPTDPFGTLISLTAAALNGGARPAAGASDAPDARGSLFDRLDRWLWKARQRDLERALATATDARDLEARLQARERAILNRYY